jgi:hypothetical protein
MTEKTEDPREKIIRNSSQTEFTSLEEIGIIMEEMTKTLDERDYYSIDKIL